MSQSKLPDIISLKDTLDMKCKPPLGVMPKSIWLEKRIEELIRAICEHATECHTINALWVEEYNDLLITLRTLHAKVE